MCGHVGCPCPGAGSSTVGTSVREAWCCPVQDGAGSGQFQPVLQPPQYRAQLSLSAMPEAPLEKRV